MPLFQYNKMFQWFIPLYNKNAILSDDQPVYAQMNIKDCVEKFKKMGTGYLRFTLDNVMIRDVIKNVPYHMCDMQKPCSFRCLLKRLALRVKFSVDDILKYFSYFSQKTGFEISCNEDNLHEISNPVF